MRAASGFWNLGSAALEAVGSRRQTIQPAAHAFPAIERIPRHVEGEVEHPTESERAFHDERRVTGPQPYASPDGAKPVDMNRARDVERGGKPVLESGGIHAVIPSGVAGRSAARRGLRSSA
jgi:hypothetical protein